MQNKQNHTSRAKLFLPFDSLKGFRDYLKCKERVVVDKKQLSSDACEVLDRKLYLHIIQIVDKVIHFRDIIEIQAENLKNISWD